MTTDPLEFLRAAHAEAQARAEAATEAVWQARDTPFGPTVHIGDDDEQWGRESQGVDAAYRCDDPNDTCADARSSYLAEAHLIASHASPAAVLRRITAERKILALHDMPHECSSTDWITREHDPCCWIPDGETCDTIRALAEGWGWTAD